MSEPHARDDNSEPRTFEEELAVLEEAVQDLENGHLTLEEAIACFENGFAAMRRCYALLRDTQKRVESLVAEEDLRGEGAASWMEAERAAEAGGGGAAFTALRSLEIRLARGAGARTPDATTGEVFEEGAPGDVRENGDTEDGDPVSAEGHTPAAAAPTKRQRRRQAPSGRHSEGESKYAGDFAGDE